MLNSQRVIACWYLKNKKSICILYEVSPKSKVCNIDEREVELMGMVAGFSITVNYQ